MPLVPPVHRVPLLVTLACAATFLAALSMALVTPLDPNIATARGPGGRIIVTTVALNGPAATDGVMRGDIMAGHRVQGAGPQWLFRTPRGAGLTLTAPPLTVLTILAVIEGWGLLLLGIGVLACSPDRPAAWAFWRLALLLAAVLTLYPAAEHGLAWVLVLHFVALRLCGPALVEVALVFPAMTHPRVGRSFWRLLLWLPALAVLSLYPAIITGGHAELEEIPALVLAVYVAGATVCLLWSCRHAPSPLQRVHLRYLAVGLLGGVAPPVVLTLVPQIVVGRPLVPAETTLLTLGALPLCVGLAIARVALFGIALRRRTRRLLQRATAPAVVAAVAGLGVLAAQEPWRLIMPFAEAGAIGTAVLLYSARHPGRGWSRRPAIPLVVDSRGAPQIQPPTAGDAAGRPLPRAKRLSPREVDVLACAAQGLHSWEIAERLHVGERTVGSHFTRIYRKLDVHTRAEAVALVIEYRILPHSAWDGPQNRASRPSADSATSAD